MPNIEQRGRATVAWQKGPTHERYEDRYRLLCWPIPLVVNSRRGEIFVVCDGVGSAPKGMAAAQEICDCLVKFYEAPEQADPNPSSIPDLLLQANRRILEWGVIANSNDRNEGACAGTVVWLAPGQDSLRVYHVGDTCAFLIRDRTSSALTTAHQSIHGHLTNYFGHPQPMIDEREIMIEESDRLVLLSDGITKALHRQQIAKIIEGQPTPSKSLTALIAAARSAGSADDATAILVDIETV